MQPCCKTGQTPAPLEQLRDACQAPTLCVCVCVNISGDTINMVCMYFSFSVLVGVVPFLGLVAICISRKRVFPWGPYFHIRSRDAASLSPRRASKERNMVRRQTALRAKACAAGSQPRQVPFVRLNTSELPRGVFSTIWYFNTFWRLSYCNFYDTTCP